MTDPEQTYRKEITLLASHLEQAEVIRNEAMKKVASLLNENEKLQEAYHEAIKQPMGVVPKGYEYLYDQTFYDKD